MHTDNLHSIVSPHYTQCMVTLIIVIYNVYFIIYNLTIFYVILVSHLKSSKVEWAVNKIKDLRK